MDDLRKASESRGANGKIHVESEIAAVIHGQIIAVLPKDWFDQT